MRGLEVGGLLGVRRDTQLIFTYERVYEDRRGD